MIIEQEFFAWCIADKLGGQIRDIVPIGKGTGHRMYSATWDQGPDAVIPITIRFFHGPRAFEEARNEAGALRELCASNYPVPESLALFDDQDLPDAPFSALQYIAGEPLTAVAAREQDRLQYWLERASDLLLRLHGLPWEDGFEWLKPVLSPLGYAERMITWWGKQATDLDLDETDPDVKRGLAWLKAHQYIARRATQQSLVHRDFHSDNLIVNGQRIVAVIDWADLRIADPAVDVGWTEMILTTEFSATLATLFVKGYTRRNPAVSDTLPFWKAFSAVKRIIQIDTIKSGQSERLGIWSKASDLGQLTDREGAVREYLAAHLIDDES
jgi:aminoglycoside phosphotransferase (APT) family kinase protein